VSTPPLPQRNGNGGLVAAPVVPDREFVERDFEVRHYTELLWHRKFLLAATAVGGLALGTLWGEMQTPRYEAVAVLDVKPPNPTAMGVADALVQTGNPIRDRQFFNTQLEVLKSRRIADQVVEQLKLEDRADVKAEGDATSFLLRHITVSPRPNTTLVDVRVQNEVPEDAALWANTLSEVYRRDATERKIQSAEDAFKWVNERLKETQSEMEEAQDNLLRSYQGQDLFVPEGSVSAITSSITTLNEDHIQAQSRRIELEAQLGEFRSMRRNNRSPDTIPQVRQDQSVSRINTRLETLNLDLTRLREKYKAGHPEVQKIHAQLAQLETDKEERVLQIEESLRAEYRQLQRREADLKRAIEGHKARAAEQSLKLTELESLKKQADAAGGLYGVLLQKLNETNIAQSIQNDNIQIHDRAVVPTSPVYPRKRQLWMVSFLAGLLLGASGLLLQDALNNRIKDDDDIERLGLEVLAAIPRFVKDNADLPKEAYQNLRTALLFAREGDEGLVVLVTGATESEGKTTTAIEVGKLLAEAGESTVIVDCDLRKANLHKQLGVPREPGFTDFFIHNSELSGLVRSTRFANLKVLPAGPIPPSPPALLQRPALGNAFRQLRQEFKWILVDSPPVQAVTDALFLARQADTTVFVVKQNKADRAVIKRAIKQLRKVGAHLSGAVLNVVDTRSRGYYGYYGYSGYSYSYGETQKKGRKTSSRRHSRARAHRSAPATPEVSDASVS
jgi:capsular exopolysaccharide synthesis family protein